MPTANPAVGAARCAWYSAAENWSNESVVPRSIGTLDPGKVEQNEDFVLGSPLLARRSGPVERCKGTLPAQTVQSLQQQ
jgi:hypothetical protein